MYFRSLRPARQRAPEKLGTAKGKPADGQPKGGHEADRCFPRGWWVDRSGIASREEHWRQEAADLEQELQKAGEYIVVKFPGGPRRVPLKSPRP